MLMNQSNTSAMSIKYNYNYPNVARLAGFKLRQFRDGPMDWRLLGSIDIERMVREESLEQIDGILEHISEAPLGAMLDTNILDSGIAKSFILSQFSVQYLLFCRKFLDETVRDLRETHVGSEAEIVKLRKALSEANNEILQLHKKMTQMEAIHEVLYPCHLCTKNFVSNESLNLHIARRHAGRGAAERQIETPLSGQKEKENDLSLINTIKLELEIKQLKERLNIAEKEIKERSAKNSKTSIREEKNNKEHIRHSAIQCNLSEDKEIDDSSNVKEVDRNNVDGQQSQAVNLEEWQQVQKAETDKSIADINEKLTVISQALQNSTSMMLDATQDKPDAQQENSKLIECLERTVIEKVEEICKGNAEKLSATISIMETNYKEQLTALEQAIKLKYENEISKKSMPVVADVHVKTGSNKFFKVKDNENKQTDTHSHTRVKRQTLNDPAAEFNKGNRAAYQYPVNKKNATKLDKEIIEEFSSSTASSQESNRTFVKSIENKISSKDPLKPHPHTTKEEDNTEMSDSLSEDSDSAKEDQTSSDTDTESTTSSIDKRRGTVKKSQKKTVGFESEEVASKLSSSPLSKPKQITRKDVKRLSSERLALAGLDMKAKSISNATYKKAQKELLEHRTKQVQKYPQFENTRSRLRKFVDKLCSSKMPKKAENLLKSTNPIPPKEAQSPLKKNSFQNAASTTIFKPKEYNASSPFSSKE